MITKTNLVAMLELWGFTSSKENDKLYIKYFSNFDCELQADFVNHSLIYPEENGFKINDKTTCNFDRPENFVVFECVCRLLEKGYRPEHLELEKRWNLGHEAKGGKADICVYDETRTNMLAIIECKTAGTEFNKELSNIKMDGGQFFSYWQQERSNKWLILYASDLLDGKIEAKVESVNCSDDPNILELAKKDNSIKIYQTAHSVGELFEVWKETYEKALCGDVIFGEDTQCYKIGVKPLRKKNLIDFSADNKIVNRFEEILRHNNVSDKENAFNRLVALFICKLVDEINKTPDDIVEFQYKPGTDTYESLQDRLQHLHQQGMDEFMKEEIFYVADDYAEKLIKSYTGQTRKKMIAELKKTIRILKFYTNNDFAFKDVHNEELFYQNGKVLVEVVQLFEKYRIIESNSLQLLGDLFEQLLNKGFKQNEGQFFTPIPVTRFIWDSLPLEKLLRQNGKIAYPKIIDYACGAGHFLAEGYEAVNDCIARLEEVEHSNKAWPEKHLYGVEKDYRLARVSKISLFMHGAGNGNIVFGDGLENYPEKEILPVDFDILVANPPYSVSAFKPHLNLKNNTFKLLDVISNDGSEIETLFVERIAQLMKPRGVAAVVLPSSILNKESNSFIGAREVLLQNFSIRAIVQFGSKTFGATGTNTIVLFLEKYDEPPKRTDMVDDSVSAIFDKNNKSIADWEDKDIFAMYLEKITVSKEEYLKLVQREVPYTYWRDSEYFAKYVEAFEASNEFKKKTTQKTFMKLSETEKNAWFKEKFYQMVQGIETEKLKYFSLVYQQTTLVVSAPDDNKEQEKFLGYKWSNRKGAEGIQIIKAGGMLYDEQNRCAEKTLASVVKDSFDKQEAGYAEAAEYYYYLRLQDMLDFSGVSFNKALKTTKTREKRTGKNLTTYSLSDKMFEISIGDRVLSTDITEDGKIPVYSANVFEVFGHIDKQNIENFGCDSVIWGIDGDWMVNCIPAGTPFYPTDHCGVLRIKNDEIIPKYMAIALQVEGTYERFSRSNRASTQRVKKLTLQIPDKKTQAQVVAIIDDIDAKISKEEVTIESISDDVKSKFIEMFGDLYTNPRGYEKVPFKQLCNVIGDGLHGTPKYDDNGDYFFINGNNLKDKAIVITPETRRINKAEYDRLFIKMDNKTVLLSINGTLGNTGFYNGEPVALGKSACYSNLGERLNREFVQGLFASDMFQGFMDRAATGSTIRNFGLKTLHEFKMIVPPVEEQEAYMQFVQQSDKSKFAAQEKIKTLQTEREEIINKYFR